MSNSIDNFLNRTTSVLVILGMLSGMMFYIHTMYSNQVSINNKLLEGQANINNKLCDFINADLVREYREEGTPISEQVFLNHDCDPERYKNLVRRY